MIGSIISVIIFVFFLLPIIRKKKKYRNLLIGATREATRRNYSKKISSLNRLLVFLCVLPICLSIFVPLLGNAQKNKIQQLIQTEREREDIDLKIEDVAKDASKMESESDKIRELMDELFYSSFTSSILDNGGNLNITQKNIDSYYDLVMDELFPTTIMEPSPDVLLQEAKDAENNTKDETEKTEHNCKDALTNANIAISKFIECLQYPNINYETHFDIRMRIGIIFYNLYQNLEELDSYDPNYRIHFLLCAYQCFNISNAEESPDQAHYWMQSFFYLGESSYIIGKNVQDLEERLNYLQTASNSIGFYLKDCEHNGKTTDDNPLYAVAVKDYSDLQTWISKTKATMSSN